MDWTQSRIPPHRQRYGRARFGLRLGLLAMLFLLGCRFPGSTRPLLKIGLLAPFEGLHRPLGYEVLYAVKLAVQERNATGGVGGWGVELVALDDGLAPADARRAAEKAAVDQGIMGIIGPFSAATADAVAPVFGGAALPWIALGPMSDSTLATTRPHSMRLFASDAALAEAAVRYAVETLGSERPAIVRGDDPALADAFVAALRQQGKSPVLDVYWDTSTPARLVASEPDVLFVAGGAEMVAELLVEHRARGMRAPVIAGPEAGSDVLVQRAGDAAEGLVWVSSVTDVRASGLPVAFVSGYRALSGQDPGPYASLAYDATHALLDAISAGIRHDGGPSRRGTATALSAVAHEGLNGRVAFGVEGGWASAPVYLCRVGGGQRIAFGVTSRSYREATP